MKIFQNYEKLPKNIKIVGKLIKNLFCLVTDTNICLYLNFLSILDVFRNFLLTLLVANLSKYLKWIGMKNMYRHMRKKGQSFF